MFAIHRIVYYKNKKKPQGKHRSAAIKIISILLFSVISYELASYTIPLMSRNLKGVAVVSAGLSFIDGGVVLARKSLAQFEAEDTDFYTSHASGEENLEGTLPNTPADTAQKDNIQEQTKPQETANEPPPAVAPPRPEVAGDVVRKTLTAGSADNFVELSSGTVKNQSYLTNDELVTLSKQPLPFALDDVETRKTAPQVLIYHTHATESYQPYSCDWYDPTYSARNTDNSQNMVAVGDVLTEKLNAAGIMTIHDNTQHDNPSYTGAYDRSRVTIQQYLDEYPSIKVILDVHRDALQGDNVITAPQTEINGKPTAQLMIISCADDGSDALPNFRQNFTFASLIQQKMESKYPTSTRSILLDERFYNQDMSVGSLLVEVGGHGNTLEEAKNAIGLFAESLITVLAG